MKVFSNDRASSAAAFLITRGLSSLMSANCDICNVWLPRLPALKARSEGDARLLFEKCIAEEKSADVEHSYPEELVVAFCLFSPAQKVALRRKPTQSSFSELSSTSSMHGSLESRELIALSLDSMNFALLLLEPLLLGCATPT